VVLLTSKGRKDREPEIHLRMGLGCDYVRLQVDATLDDHANGNISITFLKCN
jgi:hypothetical protein